MKKINLSILFLTLIFSSFGQAPSKYFTRNGNITFTSDAPMEKIISLNKEVNFILDPTKNILAAKVVMKSFTFDKQAMKDHFNLDYLQTDKFPNATFEGKISGISDYTKSGNYDVFVEGKLTIHGITKTVKQTGKISIDKNKIKLNADFNVLLSDFNVTVPNNYVKKINNSVAIKLDGVLTPYQR